MHTDALGGGTSRGQVAEVYLRDNLTNTTTLIGASTPRNAIDTSFPVTSPSSTQVSADGRYVAFVADDGRLPHRDDVYLWDREGAGNGITLVSHTPSGGPVPGGAGNVQLSANGVALTYTMGWYGHPANQFGAVYRYDIATGKRTIVNDIHSTKPGPYYLSGLPTISADGRYVAYALADGLSRQPPRVFRYDSLTGSSTLIYRPTASPPVSEGYIFTTALLSGDGRHAAFDTDPPPFADPGDTNQQPDVYEWNAVAPH
jgi:Tol biopolymer transport system component